MDCKIVYTHDGKFQMWRTSGKDWVLEGVTTKRERVVDFLYEYRAGYHHKPLTGRVSG